MKWIVCKLFFSFLLPSLSLGQGQFGLEDSFSAADMHSGIQTGANKTQLNFQLGSHFFSGDFTGTGFGTYVSPDITYQASNSIKLRLNTTLYQGYGHRFYSYGSSETRPQSATRDITTATVSLSGLYAVNSRLSVHGTVYKQFDLAPIDPDIHPNAFNFEYEGFTAGFNYHVTEKFSISGSFDYSRGQAPYNSLYNRTYFNQNPYIHSPFLW